MSISTKTIKIGDSFYCSYCGEKAKEKETWHNHRPDELFHYCECESAKKEVEINNEISIAKREIREKIYLLEKELPQANEELINKMKYEYDLKNLKRKYKIK